MPLVSNGKVPHRICVSAGNEYRVACCFVDAGRILCSPALEGENRKIFELGSGVQVSLSLSHAQGDIVFSG
eukprot:2825427-Amphidinium_carterae.1